MARARGDDVALAKWRRNGHVSGMARIRPPRILWATRSLHLSGDERILEIGCGNGTAAAEILDHLTTGTLTAIDRSATAIAAAERNVADGRVAFRTTALADYANNGRPFDLVFAINVNAFWVAPEQVLTPVQVLLGSGGRLMLFYEAPSATRARAIAERTAGAIAEHSFDRVRRLADPASDTRVGVAAIRR
jgi:cyclopropane fatty-acyl-phospholipid synthase-like methyltransferase